MKTFLDVLSNGKRENAISNIYKQLCQQPNNHKLLKENSETVGVIILLEIV